MREAGVDDVVLTAAIRDTLRQEMRDVRVRGLKLEDGFDQDGERVLLVRVVYDGPGKPSGHALAGFVRHLRGNLERRGRSLAEFPFPVMSFTARSDLDEAELRDMTPEPV